MWTKLIVEEKMFQSFFFKQILIGFLEQIFYKILI